MDKFLKFFFYLIQTEHKSLIWVTAWGQSIWRQGACAGSDAYDILCVQGFGFKLH